MLTASEDIILYHGSGSEVSVPDLAKCAQYKDFGQGFYLTTSKAQAESFSIISLRKAVANGITGEGQKYGVVSVFQCAKEELMGLSICEFEAADARWLECVVAHRRAKGFTHIIEQYSGYDVIGGKIANDATNATITAYMAGLYGAVGSERASRLCASLLLTERLPERLTNQYCFRTQKALGALHFAESYRVWK